MSAEEIRERTRSFLSEHVRGELSDDDDQELFASGILNSLMAIQLVQFIEREFGVAVGSEDLELENFNAISAIERFVVRKRTQ